jgi:hypothetical protein
MMKRFRDFVGEAVRAEDMTNPYSALLSLLPPPGPGQVVRPWALPPVGRRSVCFLSEHDLNDPKYGEIATETLKDIMRRGFERLEVAGENKAFIIHHPYAKTQALELKAIAERHGGYLSYRATDEESRRIGQLLEYRPEDIDQHIRDKKDLVRRGMLIALPDGTYGKGPAAMPPNSGEGPVRESRDWALWLALAASLGLGKAAEAKTPGEMARVVDTVRSKTDRAPYMPDFERARERVKAKVRSSPVITNKAELVRHLDSVEVREYSARSTTMMYYLHDPAERKDYVFVNLRVYRPEIAVGTFVHELNHLVDRRKRVSTQVHPGQVFLTPSYREYQEWFADWPPMTYIRGREAKPIAVGKLLANSVSSMRGYMHQPHEVYARLSSLKDYLVREGYMAQYDRLEKRHVDRLVDWAKGLKGKEYHDFLMNDFVLVLPMIDWRCLEEINMIAAGDRRIRPDEA